MNPINCAGSSESAGIKALILAKGEEPFVKTLGITILPGSHALVGMQLTEVGWKTDKYTSTVEDNDADDYINQLGILLFLFVLFFFATNVFSSAGA